MKKIHALTFTTLLTLSACGNSVLPPNNNGPVDVTGARAALYWTQQLLPSTFGAAILPSAAFGMYAARYLMDATGGSPEGALTGVGIGLNMLLENQEHPEGAFALLEQLGVVLQTDVPDMLNRSENRQKALDTYISSLSELLQSSTTQVSALKQQLTLQLKEQHDKRAIVTLVQHDLNSALQKKDYATASTKQSEIVDAQGESAKIESQVRQTNSTITLYSNLIKIGNRRLKAMQSNREILIAGLHVVDVPGITDLGVLKDQKGSQTDNITNIFGPTSN